MICPKCGEVNAQSFRFCGMCGTVLENGLEGRTELRRPVGSPVPNLPQNLPQNPTKTEVAPEPPPAQNTTSASGIPAASIHSPSMLGLDQPRLDQPSPNPLGLNQPSVDTLRERSFSGLDSFFEPEPPKNSIGRIALLVLLLAALGVAGWWAYTNYLGATATRKPTPSTETAESQSEPPVETTSKSPTMSPNAPQTKDRPAASISPAPQTTAPSSSIPENAAPPATTSETAQKSADAPINSKVTPSAPETVRTSPQEKVVAKRVLSPAPAKAVKPPAAADTGDADFRKGEAFLYGRGQRENCDEAVKYLKAASAKSNAKARSTFGTMYATGHCAPRDLPTSYLWFAMALRVDPNNQILEKDLSAVWNQMTPPERQMATRMKQ